MYFDVTFGIFLSLKRLFVGETVGENFHLRNSTLTVTIIIKTIKALTVTIWKLKVVGNLSLRRHAIDLSKNEKDKAIRLKKSSHYKIH